MLSTHGRRNNSRFFEFSKEKIREGGRRYAGSFLRVDLRKDALEEVADLCGYSFLAWVRLRRAGVNEPVLFNHIIDLAKVAHDLYLRVMSEWPAFQGPTSNEELADRIAS